MSSTESCVRCGSSIQQGRQFFSDINGNSVCANCHESQKRPCAGCRNPILPAVRVTRSFEGREYHTDCFRCGACLGTMKQPVRGSDGKLLCESCGVKCNRCNRHLLNGKFMEFGDDQRYHMQCFTCHRCNNQLGEDVYLVNDQPACLNCAQS
eukprot:TRINITY_DN18210_c0_g1_i1.p1 TRINITY_DN18210_c0_g1~~TRINITY_DN18210_c0_g1_i1.p1  ORF type:complete len:152 (+),score=18.60 TRINITY_DN18210_c0_g1_i1:95-550(+)